MNRRLKDVEKLTLYERVVIAKRKPDQVIAEAMEDLLKYDPTTIASQYNEANSAPAIAVDDSRRQKLLRFLQTGELEDDNN